VPKLKLAHDIFSFNCVQDGTEARKARSQALSATGVYFFNQKIST
jgi:hypothetical protein